MGRSKKSSSKLGNPAVIDAKRFATVYNAFWQAASPTCDLFVRRINMDGYERFDAPLKAPSRSNRQALVAEYAFTRFVLQHRLPTEAAQPPSEDKVHNLAWQQVRERLAPYTTQGLDVNTPFRKSEKQDAWRITQRLKKFFSSRRQPLNTRPSFPGCGYIDTSEADVLYGLTLFEVKTVDRMIRGTDLRQLLTYAALNKIGKCYKLSHVGVFNPRRGIYAELGLEDVCYGISGKSSEVLLTEIIEAASSGEMSR